MLKYLLIAFALVGMVGCTSSHADVDATNQARLKGIAVARQTAVCEHEAQNAANDYASGSYLFQKLEPGYKLNTPSNTFSECMSKPAHALECEEVSVCNPTEAQ